MSEPLHIATIYAHPPDHPDHFVVREWLVTRDGPVPNQAMTLHDTLAQARAAAGEGERFCIGRNEEDDPVIVESWL